MFLARDIFEFTNDELLLISNPDLKPSDFEDSVELDLFLQVNNIKYIKTRKAIARLFEIYKMAIEDPFLTTQELIKHYLDTPAGPSSYYSLLRKYNIVMPARAVQYRSGKTPLIEIIRRNDTVEDFLIDFLSVKVNNGYPASEARYWFELYKSLENYLEDGTDEETLRDLTFMDI